jgi:hypothetical protein
MSSALTTAEEAKSFVVRVGKHAGQTILAIDLAGDRAYLQWVARTWVRKEHQRIREAAIAYLTHYPNTPKKRVASTQGGKSTPLPE